MSLDEENQAGYAAWVATLPEIVRPVALRFRPWHPHRFKDTQQPCEIHSFSEPADGGEVTLKVVAPQLFGPPHLVFGVDPNNIEELPE